MGSTGPHRRGPTPAKRSETWEPGGWAHTGEGPAAKRSETWEPVGTRVIFVSTSAGWEHPRTSFYTDHYELTMLQASLHSGAAHRKSVFEAFARRLPDGRRYGIVAGTGRLLEGIANFRFGDAELEFLERTNVVNAQTLEYLASYRFSGDIWGYPEGEAYFPNSPILIVEATFAEACMLETYLLSVLNHDSAIASAASRMVTAAGGRPCIEMGSRRTHEEAATASARAAIIAGFDSTSNLEAGIRYGIKTVGTAAHSFTLLHDTERDAFEAQIASLGDHTSLLVDTYDVEAAVRTAVDLAGPRLGAVRLDSGDLVAQAQWVRRLLDDLGNENTKIVVTSDLDEYAIAALQSAARRAAHEGVARPGLAAHRRLQQEAEGRPRQLVVGGNGGLGVEQELERHRYQRGALRQTGELVDLRGDVGHSGDRAGGLWSRVSSRTVDGG